MKVGQTSILVFLSKLLGSILGFVATLYFARTLGSEVIGLYALVMTVVNWLILIGEIGIGSATTKRLSENEQQGEFLGAFLIWITSFGIVLSGAIILAAPVLENYIRNFDSYAEISVVWVIIAILFVEIPRIIVTRVLTGERKVHIKGLLNPVRIGVHSLIQIGLVILGYDLLGMFIGYIVGDIFTTLVGLNWVSIVPEKPAKRHFKSLTEFAKFSWLGSLKSRTFNEVDILLLGVFVQPSVVGIYSVAWSLSKFLDLFGSAISATMFPEISFASAQETKEKAAGLIEDSLAFTGLIVIPGLVGGTVLADRLLRIYGPEFTEGAAVLGLLILAVALYSYQKQLMIGLNGLDRPDLAFRINVIFIVLNAGLNIVLIPRLGIEGAAAASVASVAASLGLAYRSLTQIVAFRTPLEEIGRQILAALVMGAVIAGALNLITSAGMLKHNFALVLLLVTSGATVYFLVLLAISRRFRRTVARNLPERVPFSA